MLYNCCFETDVTLLFSEILLYGLLQADMTVKCFAFMDTMDALASLSRAGLYERTEATPESILLICSLVKGQRVPQVLVVVPNFLGGRANNGRSRLRPTS